MSNQFEASITLNKSHDYSKLRWLITLFAGFAFSQSNFALMGYSWLVYLFLLVFLIANFTVQSNLKALLYQGGRWYLVYDSSLIFTDLTIQFDAGFFLILTFRQESTKKTIYLWGDQLSSDDLRRIRIISSLAE